MIVPGETLFNPIEAFRTKLREQLPCLGVFQVSASPIVSEALSTSSLDFMVYDMEASPVERMGLISYLQSIKGSSVAGFVRVKNFSHEELEQVLDTGVMGILVPKVHTREIAESVVRATKYPPHGHRGVNPVRASGYFSSVPQYFNTANARIQVLVQIESVQAVDNIEGILSVEGVDGVFVGCGDLAMDMGIPGQMASPMLLEQIDKVLHVTRQHKKIPGIFAYNRELAELFIRQGYRVVAFGNDLGLLKRVITQELETLRRTS